MPYLEPTDYANFGLPAGTTADWITAATALINTYCRRPTLNIVEYTERLRVVSGARTVLLSYLPLAPLAPATSPLIGIEGRYANPRRGQVLEEPLAEIVGLFGLPGQWAEIDASLVDADPANGELTLPWNVFGLPYNEVRVRYTAGLATIGDDVKAACAQIVRNAQSHPALNASVSKMDTLWLEYFSSSLLDATVQAWLAPYVASRAG